MRHNSANSIPTSDLVCIKMASILNSQSRDLKHDYTFSNHCKVVILSRLKDQVKSLVYKMSIIVCKLLINESDFHRLFDAILKVLLSFCKSNLFQDYTVCH